MKQKNCQYCHSEVATKAYATPVNYEYYCEACFDKISYEDWSRDVDRCFPTPSPREIKIGFIKWGVLLLGFAIPVLWELLHN